MLSFKKLIFFALPLSIMLTSCGEEETPQPQPDPIPAPAPAEPVISNPALELDHIRTATVLEDRNTDPAVVDYFANKSIAVSAELTIKPGVVIAFAEDARLDINSGGSISAIGTEAKKIKFIGKTAQKGFWSGITIYSISSANNFTHTEILHTGSKPMLDATKSAIALFENARVTVTNSIVSLSGGYGIYLRDNSILVNFASNNFNNNHEAPLNMSANHASKLDEATVFSNLNGRNVIEVRGSSLTGTTEEVWPAFNDGTPYRILGTMSIRTGWKLKPGTTLEVTEDKLINIESNGYINAVGTAGKKINFTGVVKSTGSWNGIIVYTRSALNVMENAKIQYAGGKAILGGVKAGISLFGTSATSLEVRNSEISNSGGYGIHVFGNKGQLNADAETSNVFNTNAQGKIFYQL